MSQCEQRQVLVNLELSTIRCMDPHPRQLALVLEDLDTWPVMTLFGKGTPTPKTAASSGYCDRADKSGIETQEREGNEPPLQAQPALPAPQEV